MELSFTAIYKLLSVELFGKKNVNNEIPVWFRECFEKPFEGTNAESLISFLRSVEVPNSGNTAANFFNKRLESCCTEFRIGLADYLMNSDGQSLNSGNFKRIRNCISEQLAKKIEKSRRTGELYSRSDPNDRVIHDIVEKLSDYDLGPAVDLSGRIQELNRTDPFSAFMLLTIISLFGDKRSSQLSDKKSGDTLLSAQKFDQLVALLSEEDKPPTERLRSAIVTSYYKGNDFLFNEEWRHFLRTEGERTGKLAEVSLDTLLSYAVELVDEKRKHFNISNNNDQTIQICKASINAAAGHRSDISVCLYIMRLYSSLVIGYWQKKEQISYSRYFEEAKEYRRQVLSIVSDLNPCFDMSEETEHKRKLLEKQMKNGIPVTVTFLQREALLYSYTHQTEKSIDTYFNYLSALNGYSGDHIEHTRLLIVEAENNLAFVMMKAFDLANAEKYFELSLKHREQLLEDRERRLATAYSNLAQVNKVLNEFGKALDYAEKVCNIREKLVESKVLGPGSLMISENTYTDIYIRMALRAAGSERTGLLSNAKERLNKAFGLYESIESTGAEGAVSISKSAYIKSLILAGVINGIDGIHDVAETFFDNAFRCNEERFAEGVDEIFNIPYIKRRIFIRILLAEEYLSSGKLEDAGSVLDALMEELRRYRRDYTENAEGQRFTATLQWTLGNILYTRYLIETGTDRKEIQEYIDEAKKNADRLCSTKYTLNDRYRDNNRKAYGKLAEYAYDVLPFIEKGKKPQTEYHSFCFLMML